MKMSPRYTCTTVHHTSRGTQPIGMAVIDNTKVGKGVENPMVAQFSYTDWSSRYEAIDQAIKLANLLNSLTEVAEAMEGV